MEKPSKSQYTCNHAQSYDQSNTFLSTHNGLRSRKQWEEFFLSVIRSGLRRGNNEYQGYATFLTTNKTKYVEKNMLVKSYHDQQGMIKEKAKQ